VQGKHISDRNFFTHVQVAHTLALLQYSTSTPIRFKHELVTQVYFSIEGENIDGTKITGSDQTGELRMLVIPVSVVLPSVRAYFAVFLETPSLTPPRLTVYLRI
jgi:hypothetical protein